MHLGADDVAFVLGRGGQTKIKIARVSGANLDISDDGRLTITHVDTKVRARAQEYIELVLQQRTSQHVSVDFATPREDMTGVDVPTDCVGFVTGKGGAVLRSVEEEWHTLMFFAKAKRPDGEVGTTEKLAIFGAHGNRCGAELKVMSAVERKHPGWFLDGGELKSKLAHYDNGDFGIDTMPLRDDEFSYALGKMGSTRKKLARAACCILEYVGKLAVIAGTKEERARGRDYLSWLIQQRNNGAVGGDIATRPDCLVVPVARSVVGFLTGAKGSSLRQIEMDTGTFCFTDSDRSKPADGDTENLLIFSGSEQARIAAKRIVEDRCRQKLEADRYGGPGRGGGYGGGGGGYGGGGGGGGFGGGPRGGAGGFGGGGHGGGFGGGGRDYGRRDDYRRDDYRRDDRRGRSRSRDRHDRYRSRSRSYDRDRRGRDDRDRRSRSRDRDYRRDDRDRRDRSYDRDRRR